MTDAELAVAVMSSGMLNDDRCAVAFMVLNGRCPRIGDAVSPWRYRNWLRLLVQEIHGSAGSQTGFPDRWGYLAETVARRKLLPDPIPEVEFRPADGEVLKLTEKWVTILDQSGGHWTSFRDFVRFLGYGLGVLREDPGLPDGVSEALYRGVDLGQWLRRPSDYLGEIASVRFGGGPHKFFPTPHALCEAMTRMTFGGEDARAKSCCDPAMGTGRLLLHASNHSLRLAGMDIDEVMVLCTKVNLAVFAPWGLFKLDFLADAAVAVQVPLELRIPGLV